MKTFVLAAAFLAGPPAPGPTPPAPASGGIDAAVFGQLQRLKIEPAGPCSDEVFVRRVYLDVIGLLPTLEEARAFLQDKSPEKRRLLIERLLERVEFADYWAMKWSDLLRVKSEFPINLWPNAAQAYYQWIWAALRENMPYDRFARELLTAQGSNFRVPQVNFFRALQGRTAEAMAMAAALTFMGSRAEKWPPGRLEGLAACFSRVGFKSTAEWKEEIVFFKDPGEPGAEPLQARLPDGTVKRIPAGQDPRAVFADWLVSPRNPWFARNIVNRIWFWLQGRGIIHEPDDLREDNPPANKALLEHVERELVGRKWDLKHVFRIILNSRAYQLSSIPSVRHPQGEANFAWYPLRRLDAEVLIDAICQATGTTESYLSAIPEPFTFIPRGNRTLLLPDGSITSSFLELFGRPNRDTGLDAERNNRTTAAQRLHLLNSSHIQEKIEQGPLIEGLLRRHRRAPRLALDELFLTILSRPPTPAELALLQEVARQTGTTGRTALIDLAWALINSPEFLFKH